jgi:xanthine/uracil permease
MEPIKLKYGLDETPPIAELLLLGLQWFAIIVPVVIIVGKIVAGLHFSNPSDQIIYIQKIFFITGVSIGRKRAPSRWADHLLRLRLLQHLRYL